MEFWTRAGPDALVEVANYHYQTGKADLAVGQAAPVLRGGVAARLEMLDTQLSSRLDAVVANLDSKVATITAHLGKLQSQNSVSRLIV